MSPQTEMESSNGGNYIFIGLEENFGNIDQRYIEENKLKFPSYRHLYNQPEKFDLWLFLFNELAKVTNRTLKLLPPDKQTHSPNSVVVYPFLTILPGTAFESLWELYHYNQLGNPKYHGDEIYHHVITVDTCYETFLYCGTKRKHGESSTALTVLIDPLEKSVVILLTVLSALSVVIMYLHAKLNEKKHHSSLGTSILHMISVLLSPVLNNVSKFPHISKSSRLTAAWCFSCIVIGSYYTGLITSKLAYPTTEGHLESVADLLQANATVLFSTQPYFDQMVEAVTVANNTELMQLLKYSIVDKSYKQTLANGENSAFTDWDYNLFRLTTKLNLTINRDDYCSIGKEKFLATQVAFLIWQARGEFQTLVRIFIDTGVVGRWMSEAYDNLNFGRIQDRVKTSARVKHIETLYASVPPISLNAPMRSIIKGFLLECLAASMVLVFEKATFLSRFSFQKVVNMY